MQNLSIQFSPREEEINNFKESFKNFGKIIKLNNGNQFSFQKCPENIQNNKDYKISGENNNIVQKINGNGWVCILCDKELDKSIEEYIWRMKIINSFNNNPMFGVSKNDFNINSCSICKTDSHGWFYCGHDGYLYSGPPHNYYSKNIYLKKNSKEVKVIMNMKKGTLKFIIDNEDKGEAYTNIPLDKPLYPSVFLYYNNDSVEILPEK